MKQRVLLMVDASYQIYRAAAAHPELVSSNGTYTGGVYGFLGSFAKAIRETEATHCVVGLDSKPYMRSIEYPEYKQLRKKEMDPDLKERFNESEPLVHSVLRECGVPIWAVPGFEFDDLVGHVVRSSRSRYDAIYAMAKDSDLFQLMDCPWFGLYKDHIRTVMNRTRLLKEVGLTPAEYMLATALSGTHNDVAGIKGCGEIMSRRAVKEPPLMRKYRDAHHDLIERNLKLIKLPHDKFPRDARMPLPERGRFTDQRLYRWCDRLDIDCTYSMASAFAQIT